MDIRDYSCFVDAKSHKYLIGCCHSYVPGKGGGGGGGGCLIPFRNLCLCYIAAAKVASYYYTPCKA